MGDPQDVVDGTEVARRMPWNSRTEMVKFCALYLYHLDEKDASKKLAELGLAMDRYAPKTEGEDGVHRGSEGEDREPREEQEERAELDSDGPRLGPERTD